MACTQFRKMAFFTGVLALLGMTGCLEPGSQSFNSGKSTSGLNAVGGAMAAQIIFNDVNGSFPTQPTGGTTAGSGFKATQTFNPDGSAQTSWPGWLTSVEVGLTGSNAQYNVTNGSITNGSSFNYGPPFTATSNANCARFANSTENSGCNFGSGIVPCAAPPGVFRVSEMDCVYNTTQQPQVGGQYDTVYVRATLNRAALGPTENLMVVVNYVASSYNPADPNPTDCFTNGSWTTGGAGFGAVGSGTVFTPDNCSDFTWKMFMRHSATEMPQQPFMVFVPPTYSYVANNPNKTSGMTATTKQFVIPLSGDQNWTILQLSRTFSKLTSAGIAAACDANGQVGTSTGANSPLCAGLILNSITFFRI